MDTPQTLGTTAGPLERGGRWDGQPPRPTDLRRTPSFDLRTSHAIATDGALVPLLATMRMGAIVVGIDGQVGYLNDAAREALDADTGLSLRGDRIVAASPETRRKFMAALVAACRTPFVDGAVLLGPRRGPAPPRPLRVIAMERIGGRTPAAEQGLALLCLQTPRQRAPDAATLGQLFGLTGAEAMLMAGIASGRRLHQCAALRGVSLATVRAQLRNVFVKTGAATQADLTFIAWSIPGLWIE